MTVPFPYAEEVEKAMKAVYLSLRENDRRLYAAVEAAKLGHGGLDYLCSVLGCDPKTVRQGRLELDALKDKDPEDLGPRQRVRQPGAGRKPNVVKIPQLKQELHSILENNTAGSPMNEKVVWTDLTPKEIQEAFAERELYFGLPFIRQLLLEEGYRPLKMCKDLEMGRHPDRNAQFERIAELKAEYFDSDNPIMSIDTKKRELLGTFYRAGRVYTRRGLLVYDHDFPSFAEGVVLPYSLYDLKHNFGYVHLGTSRDTTEFATDSILWWWQSHGQYLYPAATSICLLCDGGGSNSSLKYLFKEDLQKLADKIGLEIRIAHYPPYCSKYNPIERRLFPHLTRAAQGVLFDSVETVKRLFEKTCTQTGLGVVVEIARKVYETGRKYAEGFKQSMKILFDEVLPNWNYRAVPQLAEIGK
jgi:hypothetical protein